MTLDELKEEMARRYREVTRLQQEIAHRQSEGARRALAEGLRTVAQQIEGDDPTFRIGDLHAEVFRLARDYQETTGEVYG